MDTHSTCLTIKVVVGKMSGQLGDTSMCNSLLIGLLLLGAPLRPDEPSARAIVEQAVETAGGEAWLAPGTLVLGGTADFYGPTAAGPIRHVDDYRMWRQMDPSRTLAHAADGKVRITARMNGKVLSDVGFDGITTWNEKGIVPKVEADALWASNFGFGIIRQALHNGFRIENMPERSIDGHLLDMVRIIDPAGQTTLFGIDRGSHFIRYMGFTTPKGWHERHYDDFIMLSAPRWVQAREVTLFYNGVRANTVHWREVQVGKPIDPTQFAPPRSDTNEGAKP